MKRRSFFQLILACCGLSKLKAAKPIHTSGYLQMAGRDYIDEFASLNVQGPRGPTGPQGCPTGQPGPQGVLEQHAFSNRFLSRYEGRPIPPNVILTQNVGFARATYQNTVPLPTQKLKSTTKNESTCQDYSPGQD